MSYKCYICGKEYNSPERAALCTIQCARGQRLELESLRTEIDNDISNLRAKVTRFNEICTTESINIQVSRDYKNIDRTTTENIPDTDNTDDEDIDDWGDDFDDEDDTSTPNLNIPDKLTLVDMVKLLKTLFEED